MRAFLAPSRQRHGSRVGATYSVPLTSIGPQELEDEKERLTLQARTSFGAPPPPFVAWRIAEDALHVPRFYGLDRFGPAEHDDRLDGDPIDLTFSGVPTEVQQRATDAIFGKQFSAEGVGGAIVSLPCGYGKTVWTVAAIARLRRKACIVVHKAVLRDQWKAAFEHFCPGVRVGFLQGTTMEMDGCDVVIAMVLTLAKRDYDPALMDCFGVVACDEAHHMAAPVMNQAMRLFRARYVVGLTATKDRPDGLTPLLHWSLGPEGFRVERDCEAVNVSVALYHGPEREILTRDGKPIDALTLNALARNPQRNAFIAHRVAQMRRAGRVIVVLSDRNAQLEMLHELLLREFPDEEVGKFVGATKDADRPVQLARPIVLSNYPMANEGLDKKELDTCVMATPKGRVTQCIGRIQRPCPTKMAPLVLDVADAAVLTSLRWTRQKYYSKEGYQVQVLQAADAREEDWFA